MALDKGCCNITVIPGVASFDSSNSGPCFGGLVVSLALDIDHDVCLSCVIMISSSSHPNDPLHGVTLETVLRALVERHGWERMADHIPIRCFMFDPTIKSSLTFLRKTPWARKKLEDWYVYDAIRDRSTS